MKKKESTLKNKIVAIILIALAIFTVWFFPDEDASPSLIMIIIAVPLFFSKKNWILK